MMSDKTDESVSVCIKEWSAAYYITKNKKWVYGRLVLIPEGVVFTKESVSKPSATNNGTSTTFNLTIPFSSFIDVKKTTSTLIYPVITISTVEDRQWFGSFTDRETVYNALTHFWKTCLIPTTKTATAPRSAKTKLGAELLSLALDSEKALSHAAKTLHHQGQQIDSSLDTMEDLHNDLDVADKLVTGLESWLGVWHASSPTPLVEPVVIKQTDLQEISNFDILYAKALGSSVPAFIPGSLWVNRREGITILGIKQEIVQHFGPGGTCLSRIRAINPWELTLTSYRVGEADLVFHIFSRKVVEAMKHLQIGRENKVEYMRPSPTYIAVDESIKTDRATLFSKQELSPHGASNPVASQCASQHAGNSANSHSDTQLMQKSEPVSEQEVQDLSDVLSNLKSMALAVQQEEDGQLENLDSLLTSVDRANARRNELDKRVKKLLN